jgi:beta-N-acetylhexosaminidase
MIRKLHAGGVVMYAFQMNTFAQTKHDISEMQKHAKIPLFISADEEGGFVERVQLIYGHRPGALETYLTGKLDKAAQLGRSIAHDLLALGINEDLAPDVDVQLVNGPDQYLRTWGYTPQSVITYAGAYMRALQSDAVIACIKHFPGLGAAQTDAHFALPIVKRTRSQLYAVELAPFKAFIQSHQSLERPGMVMPTDVLMPAIDPTWPAELSHTFITDILRKQLGYDGVVITDALYMKGIANHWTLPQAAVLALQAGNDMLLGANGPYQMQDMLNGLKAALQHGQLSKARIDEAATRIITLKLERKLLPIQTL